VIAYDGAGFPKVVDRSAQYTLLKGYMAQHGVPPMFAISMV
jgi:hypothetical protein